MRETSEPKDSREFLVLNEMCYSEYYAVNRSGTVRQYFDRFCVHHKHCLDRGIDESCQTLEQLDKGIQKTFFKYHHAKPSRKTLMHSRFCCCETDRCNDFDSKMAYDIFGIISTSHKLPSLISVIILLFMCFVINL
ncbi:hypothetical protein OESDEN_06310 [Oesophagostomum dentatum]|uniref:DUF7773 domain-containing protein n=1 Tax=Oesophagostomum dentatum TaxID=61180 RepID=A0A0B1T952_OESDE|nr:hypothetical protein OESDEN_06310 [Oesophagostomum dentatum]